MPGRSVECPSEVAPAEAFGRDGRLGPRRRHTALNGSIVIGCNGEAHHDDRQHEQRHQRTDEPVPIRDLTRG
jgi:hypothetical protein